MTKEVVILIADDDPGHIRLIEKNLSRAGLHNSIQKFEDGQQVLDFFFGKGKGPRRKPDAAREVSRWRALGCNNYIVKPVDYERVAEAIRNLGLFIALVEIPEIER